MRNNSRAKSCREFVGVACWARAVAFAALATFMLAPQSDACSPPQLSALPVQEIAKNLSKASERIFVGRVTGVERINVPTTGGRASPRNRISAAVERAIKGRVSDVQQVDTGIGGGDCGVEAEKGAVYLFFVSGSDVIMVIGADDPSMDTYIDRLAEMQNGGAQDEK